MIQSQVVLKTIYYVKFSDVHLSMNSNLLFIGILFLKLLFAHSLSEIITWYNFVVVVILKMNGYMGLEGETLIRQYRGCKLKGKRF